MNVNELLELIRAGYTKEEIAQLNGPAEDPAATPAGDPAATPAGDPEGAKAFERIVSEAIASALARTQPAAAESKPEKTEPKKPEAAPKAEDSAARILAALGIAAQGVAIPREETLEDRMANSLRLALGIPEDPKKEEGGK